MVAYFWGPECPNCEIFEKSYGNEIVSALNEGKLTVRYHSIAILDSRTTPPGYSTRASNAALCAVPAGLAVFFWPVSDFWMLGSIKVPFAMLFAMIFGFFGAWFATLSYSAVSQMVNANERSVAAALLNLFITLLGVGAGPLVTGILSDYFAKTHGTDGLRWALSGVTCMFLFTVLFFVLAINPYKQRLQQMKSA